jgi:DHA1 family tetracycline resistance protein-like MFS transporter
MHNKKLVKWLFVITTINQLEIGVMLPLAPLLFIDSTYWFSHALTFDDPSTGFLFIGLLFFSYSFAQFLAAPFLGRLSDAWGRKKVLLLSAVTILLGQLIFLLGIFHLSLVLLFIGRILAGLGDAVSGVVFATVSDISTGDERIKSFGVISGASGVGVMFGASLYLVVDQLPASVLGSTLIPFATLTVLSALNILLIAQFLPETIKQKRTLQLNRVNPIVTLVDIYKATHLRYQLLLIFWFIFSLTLFTSFTPTYLTEVFASSQTETSSIILVFSLLIAISQIMVIPALVNRFSRLKIVQASFFISAVSVFALTQISNLVYAYLLLLPAALSIGILYTLLLSSVSLKSSPGNQGESMGLAISAQTLAQMLPGLAVAILAYQFGAAAPLYLSAGLFCLAVLFVHKIQFKTN